MRDLQSLETPKLLIDEDTLNKNIQYMQEKANEMEVSIRPHVKTHKSVFIAEKQVTAGAQGITVAKVGEAIRFINKGFDDVFIAYPVIAQEKIERLLRTAKAKEAKVSVGVDSILGIQSIIKVAESIQYPIAILLEIDTGYHRTGFSLNDQSLLVEACIDIQESNYLKLEGIFSHAGHAYGANNKKQLREIAEEDRLIMKKVKKYLKKTGYAIETVSIDSTPTCIADHSFKSATEIRPGNYALLDLLPFSQKLIELDRIAISVLATVVSENEWYYFVDAGSKVLSTDSSNHGSLISGHGLAFSLKNFTKNKKAFKLVKVSEEHGWIKKRKNETLEIGQKIRILPNHACTVMNLSDKFTLVRGDQVIKSYPIDARGATL